MEPVGVAVLGTGSIGMTHLKVLAQIPEVRAVAIPTRPGRVKDLEETGFFAVKDLDEALRIPVARCIVATDTGRHVEDGLSAIERGLDVLVEKPISTDARQARRLCLARAKFARQVFVGCVLRFSESLNTFRKLLNRVGKLHSVRIECQSYLPEWRPARPYKNSYSSRAGEGGVLLDLIHEIDYAGWIFGWPKAVQARDFTYVDDIARGTLAGLKPVGYEVINLGSDKPIVLNDAIRLAERLIDRTAKIEFQPRHPADVEATRADIGKAERLLRWRPTTKFEDGVASLVEWYRRKREWAKDVGTD